MAIYNTWGDPIEITGNLGLQQTKDMRTPATLIEFKFEDAPDKPFYIFAERLRADNGWAEIIDAVNASPVLKLSSVALKQAIKGA